jgi:hypothetical protein
MSSSINIIDNNLDSAIVDTLKEEFISLMPKKMSNKLGITLKNPR